MFLDYNVTHKNLKMVFLTACERYEPTQEQSLTSWFRYTKLFNYTQLKIEWKNMIMRGNYKGALKHIQEEFNQTEIAITSKFLMNKIQKEAKLVGGVGNIIMGGQSQGAQEMLGTAIHFKDRWNQSFGGIIDTIGPVPMPPNGA
jgi:hypothetical protein